MEPFHESVETTGLDEHRAMDKRGLETFSRLEAQWPGPLEADNQ